jgi:hypothetical protein
MCEGGAVKNSKTLITIESIEALFKGANIVI